MSENENITPVNEEPVEETTPPAEELPMEDKKKAINLQDLVYVKQYIDKSMETKLAEEIPEMVANEMNEGYYTQAETDSTFYKKTDTVNNAVNATNAENATNAVNADHANKADSATNADNATNATHADDATHADSADTATTATNAGHADESDYATNAGHALDATHADSADTATNAENAVLGTDGNYVGLELDADGVLKLNNGSVLKAESAVNATNAENAGHATIATNAENADHATTADTAESANEALNANHATTADLATNAENAIAKHDGTYGGFTLDENGVLKIGDKSISCKQLIWADGFVANSSGALIAITLDTILNNGDKIEVLWSYQDSKNSGMNRSKLPIYSSTAIFKKADRFIHLNPQPYLCDDGSGGFIAPYLYPYTGGDNVDDKTLITIGNKKITNTGLTPLVEGDYIYIWNIYKIIDVKTTHKF